jgi:DnaJ-class molecular chaperone
MPRLNSSSRGDLYAEITVQLPKNLSEHEKNLFAELARHQTSGSSSADSASAA